MYKTVVKVKIIDDKRFLSIFGLLFAWLLLFMISFIFFVKGFLLAFPFMIVIFLMIIPIFIYILKKRDIINEDSFVVKEVVFDVVDGVLYTNGIKLDVQKSSSSICVSNEYDSNVRYVRNIHVTRFLGFIEEPYVNDFNNFLLKNGVKEYK